jgi:hypothetical protein
MQKVRKHLVMGLALAVAAFVVAILFLAMGRQIGGIHKDFDYRDAEFRVANWVGSARLMGGVSEGAKGSVERRSPYTLSVYVDPVGDIPRGCRMVVEDAALRSVGNARIHALDLLPADVNSTAGRSDLGFWEDDLEIEYLDYELSFLLVPSDCDGLEKVRIALPIVRDYRERTVRVIDVFLGV